MILGTKIEKQKQKQLELAKFWLAM